MYEKNIQITKDSDEVRRCIVASLKVVKEILEDAGKECGVHEIWYLSPGIPVEKIEEIIYQLRYIIRRINSFISASNEEESQKKEQLEV